MSGSTGAARPLVAQHLNAFRAALVTRELPADQLVIIEALVGWYDGTNDLADHEASGLYLALLTVGLELVGEAIVRSAAATRGDA